jgi:hypothetical protein
MQHTMQECLYMRERDTNPLRALQQTCAAKLTPHTVHVW